MLNPKFKKTLQKQAKDQRKDKYGKNDELLYSTLNEYKLDKLTKLVKSGNLKFKYGLLEYRYSSEYVLHNNSKFVKEITEIPIGPVGYVQVDGLGIIQFSTYEEDPNIVYFSYVLISLEDEAYPGIVDKNFKPFKVKFPKAEENDLLIHTMIMEWESFRDLEWVADKFVTLKIPKKYKTVPKYLYRGITIDPEVLDTLKSGNDAFIHLEKLLDSWSTEVSVSDEYASRQNTQSCIVIRHSPSPAEVFLNINLFYEKAFGSTALLDSWKNRPKYSKNFEVLLRLEEDENDLFKLKVKDVKFPKEYHDNEFGLDVEWSDFHIEGNMKIKLPEKVAELLAAPKKATTKLEKLIEKEHGKTTFNFHSLKIKDMKVGDRVIFIDGGLKNTFIPDPDYYIGTIERKNLSPKNDVILTIKGDNKATYKVNALHVRSRATNTIVKNTLTLEQALEYTTK